jgi:hypothetical protein
MRIKAAFVFFLTALLCGIAVASLSYVGVWVSYVGLPILLVSGYFMVFGSPKTETPVRSPSLIVEAMGAVSGLANDFSDAMDGVNNDLARFNRKNELKRERTEKERIVERELRLQRAKCDVRLRYASSIEEKRAAQTELDAVDKQLTAIRETMAAIEKQCEIDAIEEQRVGASKS